MKTTPTIQTRRLGLRRSFLARALPAVLTLAALAVPARSLAQAPTFNALVTTYTNVGSGFPDNATVGDINGDGKLDAIVTGGDNPSIMHVMLGNGNGTFTDHGVQLPQVTTSNVSNLAPSLTGFLPVAVGGFGQVKAIDVNHDGKLDLVTIESVGINFVNYSFIGVLINTGNDANGVPQFTATHYYVPFLGARTLTLGDLNGDGAPDLTLGFGGNGIYVWLNNGSGGFTPGQLYSLTPGAGGPAVGQAVIADLNGDGKADYVVTSNQNGGANIFFGNGDGTLQAPIYLPNGAVSVAVADVNGDGKPDLLMGGNLTSSAGSEGLMVYLNNGGGSFGAPTLYNISSLNGGLAGGGSVAVADINGDGILDAVLSNLSNNTVAVLLGDGLGGFGTPITFSAQFAPTWVFVGDFNGDGKPDIGVDLRNSRNFGVLTNTTPAALPTQTLTILGGSGSVGAIAANVEYYNPATGNWQPTYLTGGHPWGFVTGTNSWINYKASNGSDAGAGPTTNQTLWYLYRVRFTVPSDAINPKMTFSLKADNFAQVAINGVTAGGTTQYINNTNINNVVVGQADQVNVDAAFSQNVHVGENTITLNIGDWGGLNGFNFRIDLSMQSSQPLVVVTPPADTTPPVITKPADITKEATGPSGAVVTFSVTATDAVDGSVPVVASPASGSTFAIGTTAVGLAATDAAHNTATASFTVTVRDTIAPVVTVPTSITAEATSANGAAVTYAAPTATDAVGVTSLTSAPASGSAFPLGTTTVTATAKDAAGNTGTGSFTITVRDTTAPAITSITPSIATIWPPNKKMVPITVTVVATDAVGVASAKIVSVATNQPDSKTQWQITGPLTVNLLADREGDDKDRIYTLTIEVRDAAGNVSTKTTTVTVPHDQGKDKEGGKELKDGKDSQDEKSGKDDKGGQDRKDTKSGKDK